MRPTLWLTLLAGLLLTTLCGCQQRHRYGGKELDQAVEQLSFPQAARDQVDLLLDSSASMRGFALAAVKNEQTPAGSWVSVFVGIDSLSRHIRFSRFGGSVEAHAGPVELFPLVVGRQRVEPIGQVRLDPTWRSRSCDGRPLAGGGVVDAIDALFSERETCLGLALDQASKAPDPALRIVLTDSEQAAREESAGCPLGNNPTPVQDRLYDWVHNRLRFGAIVLLRLPYEGWKVAARTLDYCHCAQRNLFLYLLGPSAGAVEKAYADIAERWQGEPSDIAYLPLAPRPAAQYQLRMTIPRTAAGDVPASIEGSQQRLEPASGQLPVFFVRLDQEKAVVHFTLEKAAFSSAAIRPGAAGSATLPLAGDLDWGDEPSLVEILPPRKGAKSPSLRLAPGTGAVEFVRLPEPSDQEKAKEKLAHDRDAQFFSGARKMPEAGLTSLQLTGTWEIRRRQGAKQGACELYLFELYAHGGKLVDRLIAATPLLQTQDHACSGLDNITAQVRHVYQETPVARFLLHIDS